MVDDKPASAFHEAGHCIQALYYDNRSFASARIVEINNRWEGDTNIEMRDISDIDRVNVALAGVVAEGLACAKEHERNAKLHEAAHEAFKAIADIVCFQFYTDPSPVWRVELVANGRAYPANISRKDIENIPPGYRSRSAETLGVTPGPKHLESVPSERGQGTEDYRWAYHWTYLGKLVLKKMGMSDSRFRRP